MRLESGSVDGNCSWCTDKCQNSRGIQHVLPMETPTSFLISTSLKRLSWILYRSPIDTSEKFEVEWRTPHPYLHPLLSLPRLTHQHSPHHHHFTFNRPETFLNLYIYFNSIIFVKTLLVIEQLVGLIPYQRPLSRPDMKNTPEENLLRFLGARILGNKGPDHSVMHRISYSMRFADLMGGSDGTSLRAFLLQKNWRE
jgi:hypothetical protein